MIVIVIIIVVVVITINVVTMIDVMVHAAGRGRMKTATGCIYWAKKKTGINDTETKTTILSIWNHPRYQQRLAVAVKQFVSCA